MIDSLEGLDVWETVLALGKMRRMENDEFYFKHYCNCIEFAYFI